MKKISIFLFMCFFLTNCATAKHNKARLLTLDVDHFKNTMTIKDDQLEVDVEFNTQKGFHAEFGVGGELLIGLMAGAASISGKGQFISTDYFLRAFLKKETGQQAFQVCCPVKYVDNNWRFYKSANFGRPLRSVEVSRVGSDVKCSGKGGCTYTEQLAFLVPKEELQRAISEYDPNSQEIQFWPFKFKAQSGGDDLRGNIALQEIVAILETVDAYRPIKSY